MGAIGIAQQTNRFDECRGYWDPLIALMDHMINSGFADHPCGIYSQADAAGVVAHWY